MVVATILNTKTSNHQPDADFIINTNASSESGCGATVWENPTERVRADIDRGCHMNYL